MALGGKLEDSASTSDELRQEVQNTRSELDGMTNLLEERELEAEDAHRSLMAARQEIALLEQSGSEGLDPCAGRNPLTLTPHERQHPTPAAARQGHSGRAAQPGEAGRHGHHEPAEGDAGGPAGHQADTGEHRGAAGGRGQDAGACLCRASSPQCPSFRPPHALRAEFASRGAGPHQCPVSGAGTVVVTGAGAVQRILPPQ